MTILKNTKGEGLAALAKIVNTLKEKDVFIGVTRAKNATRAGGINQATLMKIHEFGAKIPVTDKMRGYLAYKGMFLKKTTQFIVIPERSTLRATIYENRGKYAKSMGQYMVDAVKTGRTGEDVLGAIGTEASSDVRAYMANGALASNHPFTTAQKGSSKPLIDSGNLRGSISYEVR